MLAETIDYRGHEIAIHTDDYAPDPRKECDNLGTMICWHGRYDLGDEHDFENPKAFEKEITAKNHIILSLYLYDHSGITMNTTGFHCKWDSGQVGYIYVSKEAVRKEWGWQRMSKKRIAQIEEYLRGEVSTYDQNLTGDIYGYNIEDLGDSCWGFYGRGYVEQQAKDVVDYYEEAKTEFLNTAKGICIPLLLFWNDQGREYIAR